jgi:predicted metalloprotease with PDZ domain
MPALSRGHSWLDEGLASYVEPIVRARAGLITPEKLWGDLVDGMPQGLPEAGDEGLERTHTWGRTYWGGALFCLMLDVTLRERSANTRSLDDLLRGIVATGADVEDHWSIERWLDEAERATGTSTVRELYRDMALAPRTIDLPALWTRLGVRTDRRPVTFDERAPLAAVRRAISARR